MHCVVSLRKTNRQMIHRAAARADVPFGARGIKSQLALVAFDIVDKPRCSQRRAQSGPMMKTNRRREEMLRSIRKSKPCASLRAMLEPRKVNSRFHVVNPVRRDCWLIEKISQPIGSNIFCRARRHNISQIEFGGGEMI